jgi:uncharacterized FlaG/YvyC family protein
MNTDPISSVSPSAGISNPSTSRGSPASVPNTQTVSLTPIVAPQPSLSPSALAAQEADVRRAVAESNAKLTLANINLQFRFNLETNGSLRSVQLLDSSTQQVVIQYPSETMLAIRDQIDLMIEQNQKPHLDAGSLFSRIS